jgi:hypothetical protein
MNIGTKHRKKLSVSEIAVTNRELRWAAHLKNVHADMNGILRKTSNLFQDIVCYDSIDDSPYYVFVALCIVVIVVSLIFKMAYFLSWPVRELLKKARVRLDLLQVSLSLSYRSTVVYITWRSTERRSEKERLVKSRFKTEPKIQDLL